MGQRSKYAAVKDAQIMLRKEECALDMGQRLSANYAAVKDAQIKLRKEECALDMGQRSKYAAGRDAQIKLRKEECAKAKAMEQRCCNVELRSVFRCGAESMYEKTTDSLTRIITIAHF